MIIGQNEKLETTLKLLADKDSHVDYDDVLDKIVDRVAVGDIWQMPVEPMDDEMEKEDYPADLRLKNISEFVKRTVRTSNAKHFFCAFTSGNKVSSDEEGMAIISIPYPARDLIQEFVDSEICDGLMLNPWSDCFIINRAQAEKILENAEKVPERQVGALCSIRIEPRAVLDTNKILASWDKDWEDRGDQEDWRLIAYPIMADGRILLLFEMRDEICAGKYDTFHVESTYSHYRVLEYKMEDDKLQLIKKYRFKAQNSVVTTVYQYNDELKAVISVRGNNRFSALTMVPEKDKGQFKVFGNTHRFASNSCGDLVVAYKNNLYDEYRLPVLVFDQEGEIIGRVHDENALRCADINLDAEENVWYHLFPSSSIEILGKNESHKVELSGWDCFALSRDKSKLFLSFDAEEGGSVQYILSRDKQGNYAAPIRFDFRPTTETGEVLTALGCDVFGICSSMKSWVLINADGRLFLYDIDDCSVQ